MMSQHYLDLTIQGNALALLVGECNFPGMLMLKGSIMVLGSESDVSYHRQ